MGANKFKVKVKVKKIPMPVDVLKNVLTYSVTEMLSINFQILDDD